MTRPITGLVASLTISVARAQVFNLYVGDDSVLNFVGDSTLGDITGWSILYVQRGYQFGVLVVEFTQMGVITSGPSRTFTFAIEDADTIPLPSYENHEWEVRRTDPGNEVVIASGVVNLLDASPPVPLNTTHFSVIPANPTPSTGVSFNFTVSALNSAGNVVTSYGGTVVFTSSDSSATLPSPSTLVNGVGTFSATLVTLGGQHITATDSVTAGITGTGFVNISSASNTPTPLSASVNDYNPGAGAVQRWSATTTGINVTGMVAGRDGEVRIIQNVGTTYTFFLTNLDPSSTSVNRWDIASGQNAPIPPGSQVQVTYSVGMGKWLVSA